MTLAMIVAMTEPGAIQVASIGIPDTLFLMLLALVVFGPRRLPEIGRQIGKLMYEFRKVSNDFKFQMEEELRASEEADRLAKMQAALPAPGPLVEALGPHTSEPALELTDGAEAEPVEAEGVPGEVRGEPRKFPPTIPTIAPPSMGETVAAQKPFRGRVPEASEAPEAQTVGDADSNPETAHTPEAVSEAAPPQVEEAHHG